MFSTIRIGSYYPKFDITRNISSNWSIFSYIKLINWHDPLYILSLFHSFYFKLPCPRTGITHGNCLLIQKVKELFDKLYVRRQLIRLIRVRFTDLIAGTYQINLFSDTQEIIKLYQTIDSVKKQYGEKYLISAGGYPHAKT
jgi:hypothetical protein